VGQKKGVTHIELKRLKMAALRNSIRFVLNKNAQVARNGCLVVSQRNAQIAACVTKVPLLNVKAVENQRCEQKRFIWPFTSKGYCEMTYRQVNDLVIAKDSLILDCRRFDEIKEHGKIPYAEVVPVEEIEEAFQLSKEDFKAKYGFEKPKKHDQIVVYCRSGRRAASAAFHLVEQGYDHVCRYEGSWEDWVRKQED
jgi:rhodanese-related sulfurtransferase